MIDDNKRRKIYDALSNDYDMPSYEQFSQDMADEGKRRKMYDAMAQDYDMPSFEVFTQDVTDTQQQPQQPAQAPTPQANTPHATFAPMQRSWKESAMPEDVRQRFERQETPSNYRQADTSKKQPTYKESPSGKSPSEDFRKSMDAVMERTQQSMDNFGKNAEAVMENSKKAMFGGYGKEYNPTTGKFENVYYTLEGGKVGSMIEQADDNLRVTNPEKWQDKHTRMQVSGIINDADKQIEDKQKELFALKQEASKANQGEGTIEQKRENYKRLKEQIRAKEEEIDNLKLASKAAEEAREWIEASDLKREDKNALLTGLGNILSKRNTWTFGVDDYKDMVRFKQAAEAYKNGEELTEEQQLLLQSQAVKDAVQGTYNVGRSYNIGTGVGESVPYMIEFLLNPATGLGSAASKAAAKYVAKKIIASEVKKGVKKGTVEMLHSALKKGGEKRLVYQLAKYGTRGLGDVAAAGTITSTSGQGRVLAGTMQRQLGNTLSDYDKNGNVVYAGQEWNDQNVANLYWKEFTSQMISNYSEMLGNYLSPALKELGFVMRGMGKGSGKVANGLQRVDAIIGKIGDNKIVKEITDFERKAQFHGALPETLEELADGSLNAAFVGDQTFDTNQETGIWNRENLIQTALVCGVMGTFFSGVKSVGYGKGKISTYRNLRKADNAASAVFGDQWDDIRKNIKGAGKNIEQVLNSIADNPDYTPAQKIAAVKYAAAKIGADKVEEWDSKRERKDAHDLDIDAIGKTYESVYDDATSDELRLDANIKYADTREKVRQMVGDEMLQRLDEDPFVVKAEIDNDATVSNNVRFSVAEYLAAKAAVDGINDRINDDADMMAAEQREEAKKRQYKDGSIHPATMKGEKMTKVDENGNEVEVPREVYVVDGDFHIDADGNISGDDMIIVYDPVEGRNRTISPAEIAELVEVTTAEQQEQNIEANKQAYIQQQMDAATGRFNPQPGQLIDMPDGNKAVVIATDGETVTLQMPDGTQQSMAIADIQQIADGVAMEDYRQRHPEATAAPEQPVTEQPKGTPETFEPMMELTIKDEDGNEQQVVVTGGRARFTGKGYEDDPNGKFVELYVAGSEEPRYIREDDLKKMVTDYKEAEQPKEEPVEGTQSETQSVGEEAPVAEQPEEQPAEPAAAVEPHVAIYNNVKGEYPESYRDKVENTVKIKAKRVADTKKALDKANDALTATEYGSKEESTAKEKRDKAQQAYDAAVADNEQWKAIKSLKDQEMLAEQESKDAERKAKAEQRRAETEAARKRDQEAYETEMARRKAEKDKKMEASIKTMQEMSEEATTMEQMAKEFPIEQDAEAMEIMNDRSPRTLEEVAAWMLGDTKGDYKIDPELIRDHTGYGTTDLKKFPFVFKKGGMSPEAFGEKIEQTARENDVVFKDNENGFSALLNVLGEVGGLGDLKNYIKENHRKLAEKVHSDRLREAVARKADDKSMQQNSGMNDKQQDNYMASMEQAVESGVTMMTDEETEALFSDDAVDPFESKEENQKTNSNDTRTETNDEGGDQRGAEKGGADESEAGQAGVAADDKRGDSQLEGEPQPAEQPAGEVAEAKWDEHRKQVLDTYDKEYERIEKADGERLRNEARGYSDERLLNTYINDTHIANIFGKGREGISEFIGTYDKYKAPSFERAEDTDKRISDAQQNHLEAAEDAARQSFVIDVLKAELDRRGIEYKDDYNLEEFGTAADWLKANQEEQPKQQKTGGEATKTSKRDRGLLEVVMDKLRKIIGDRLHTTLTEDEKGLINWANAKTKGMAPVFYSNAERAVEGIKQEKATAEQWLAMIQKAGGLKAGEDKWMGLSDWLNDHKGKSLTKQEVLDFIRDNQIRMEEVNYAEDGDYPNYAEEMATRRELVAFEDEMSEKYGNGWENKLNEAERLRFENLNSSLENYKKSESRPINNTRLKYTTDFLDNKREIAFVVPNIESWNESDEVHFGDAGEGRAVAWVRFGDAYMPADGGAARQEFERIMKDNDEWYAAHPMFAKYGIADKGENLDALNKESEERKARQREALAAADAVPKTVKVLVIDEIQSKRHQEGREKGYRKESTSELIKKQGELERRRIDMVREFQKNHPDDVNNEAWDAFVNSKEYKDILKEESETEDKIRASYNLIPDAPFEKNWHEVAMKRMLRYAAENGYDKVAWTTGEQQAERYSLGHKVYQITSTPYEAQSPSESDGHDLMVNMSDGTRYEMFVQPDGTLNSNEELFDGKNVADVFGKELGNKIMSATEETDFSGNDLRVGAEGMKGFYDQILPRFMDKYGKKWGVKTTDVELPNVGDNGLTMHSVDVTPEMKKSVLEGQPMFHKVFHGSGADFERFDSSHMGEGEGAQAYGYGHYTTEVEGIGRTYAKAMGQYEYQGRKYNDIRDNWKGDDATQRVVLDVLKYLDKDNDTRSVQEAIDFSIKVKELRIARKIGDVEEAKRELDALKNLSVEDFKTSATLYTVEIPDDNGSNYLEWNGKLSNKKVNALQDDLLKDERFMSASRRQYDEMGGDRIADDFPSFEEWVRNHAMVVAMSGMESGQRLYKELSNELGGDKAASEFLHNAGFVGIKYPAEYRSGGRSDGAKNYVIFNEGDLKITDKIKFFKTPQGEVYGFTVGGNIYVDMDIAKADTPIHEYGHLWVPMVRESDPEMWEDIKSVLTKDKDVKPFMDIVRQRYPELTAEGREDDFMEEVFTHFSGDNGLKMLEEAAREYEEQDGQGFISKAKAIAALNKVKEALDKFWGKVAQLFGIKFRNAREVANKMMKDFMDEVDPTKVRTERIKNEGLKPEEEKTLMGVHNISEEKLRKAMKNGGFANPSMAVIDTKNGGFDSYGDISLIPRSSLIDARTGRNAGTYSGDAYTPVYPNVEYYEGKETEQKLQELTSNLPESLGEYIRRKVSNYMDRNSNNSGLEYLFLKEHGIDMPIVHNERRYPGISTKQIAERMGVSEDLYGSDLYKEYEKMPEDQRFDFNLWLQHYGNEEDIAKVKNLIAEMQEKGKEKEANYLIDHYTKPMNFAHFDSTVYNISRDEREAGEENLSRTVEDAAIEVNKQGLRNEFDAWQQKVIDGLGYEEKLFAGYTPSGYRKYLPNTAENASKLMNKQEDTNAGNDTGLNATRSALLYKMQSLDDIRQHRDLLQGNDAYGERQSEMTDELLDLAHQLSDMQKIDDNPFINTDYAILRMQDAFTKKDPIGYLNKEYGYSIDKDSEFAKQMLDFMNEVRDLPAKYFETKFKRPVALDEFAVAVVPEGTSKDVVDALKNAGLDVRTYDGTSENRQAVTLDAVRGRDDIMFQKADNKSTEREVEPYKAPKKNDGEDLIDYAKRVAEDYEDYKKNTSINNEDNVPSVQARDAYERSMGYGANQFKEAVQDSMLSLKELYRAILGENAKIEEVKGYENAYLAENRMHSASEAQAHAYQQDFMVPIVDAIYDLIGHGRFNREKYDDLVDYMMAKHGLERNRVFAERDAQAAAKKGADYNEELQKNQQRDYAGLTALTGESDVATAEAMAQKMVDDYEANHDTTALWEKINRATKQSLYTLYSSGMMTKERYEQIRDMFDYYIPLQGFDSTVAEDVYAYLGSDGTLGYGTPIRTARGRKSKADDPIATIAMNGEAAIRSANRNEMKKNFLNFVQNHPSDLVSVSDVWLKYNDVTGEWEQVTADLQEGDSPADVERKTKAFDEKMEQLSKSDPDHYKRSADMPNVPYRVVQSGNMKQHQVTVKRNGKDYVLTINGNPRAAQALNGLTNPDVFTEGVFGKAMNLGQWLNRQLSAFYTTRNPEFVLSNFLRDAIYSNMMVGTKEDGKYAMQFHKNFGKMNPVSMGKLFAAWENGSLREKVRQGTCTETERMFYDFMMNGGETGWTNMRDIEKHKKEIQDALKMEGSTNRKAWKALGSAFDLMNRSVENCARFAAFVTSREMGRSLERSIWDAKEISVNFNKKGAGDKFLTANNQNLLGQIGAALGGLGRGLYVFWNASVQGLNNIARGAKKNPWKFAGKIVATNFLLGALMPILNEILTGGDDDDENSYYNLPEYIRRSNICFRFSKDMPWITIPLPIEFRAIYGLGELATGMLTGKERYNDEEFAKQFVSQLSQVLPLDFMEGGGGWHAFVPSQIKPFVEAQGNKSWTGLPIYKDSPYNQNDPEWTKAYKSANKQLVEATKWLNDLTNGSDYAADEKKGWIDINPAKLEYMLKGYFGGYTTMLDRFVKTAETVFGDRDFEWRNIPMASRVLREGDERTAKRKLTNEYFDLLKEYDETKSIEKKKREKAESGDYVAKADYVAYTNFNENYKKAQVIDNFKPLLDALKDEKKNQSEYSVVEIEERENELRREMVDLIHSIQDAKKGQMPDIETPVDHMLDREFDRHGYTSNAAASRIASRMGGTDGYGSGNALETEYGKVYYNLRDHYDLRQDVAMQVAIKQATDAGDKDRASDLDKERNKYNKNKKEFEYGAKEAEQALQVLRVDREQTLEDYKIPFDKRPKKDMLNQ